MKASAMMRMVHYDGLALLCAQDTTEKRALER